MSVCPLKYKIVGKSISSPVKVKKEKIFHNGKSAPDVWRFYLSEKESWLDVFELPEKLLPTPDQFEALWRLKPEKKGIVKMMGKDVETPRWQQGYGIPYKFSGIVHKSLELPKEMLPYIEHANETKYCGRLTANKELKFNEAFVNWYQDGTMYIGPHSDKTDRLVLNSKKETLVWSITLQEKNTYRTFRLKPKTGGKDRLDVEATNGIIMVMGGRCQETHKHQVPKIGGKKAEEYGRRINITFRIFDTGEN